MADTIEDRIRRNQEAVSRPRGRMMEDVAPAARGVEPDPEATAAQAKDIQDLAGSGRPNIDPFNAQPLHRFVPPAAPKEQGILPGEEQVTTQDTFRMLPADAKAALQNKFATGGHAGTMGFDDWLSDNFGDLPPPQRAESMKSSASAIPVVNVGKRREVSPEYQATMAARRQDQYARDIGNRYSNMLTPEEQQMIDWAATAPDGMQYLRGLNADLRRRYERDRHTQVRDRATNYNLSQDLRNPNYAPGMGVRSLIEAVRSGNSEMAGAVYDIYGNPVAGGQSRQLAGVRARAEADQQAAQIEADNAMQVAALRGSGKGDEPDPLKMDVLANELDRALANPDPVRRSQAVKTVIAMNPLFTGKDEAVIESEAQRVIASHMARSGTPQGRQHALKYLDSLKGNKDRYISFAVDSLGVPPQAAEQMYNSVANVGFLGGIERAFSGK